MSIASAPDRSTVSRSALAVLLLAPCAACGSGDAPGAGTLVRDSAGVALVETTGEDRPLAWHAERVQVVPALEEEGDGFFSVAALTVVPGRRIAVMDRDGHRVVLLDEEGRFLARAGRQGEGPGEFQFPIRLFAHADGGVSVFDMMNARLETFDAELRHLGSEPVGGLAYYGGEITDLGDVRILSASDPAVPSTERVLAVSTTDTIEIVRTSRETGGTVTLESCGMSFSGMPPIFSPGTRWTAGPDGAVFVAVSARFDIHVYEPPTFALTRRIHRPVPPLEPTEELAVASVGDGMRVMTPAGARTCDPREVVEERGMASPVPPIAALVVSPAGELFVKRWSLPDEDPAIDVLSARGDYLGTLPPGFPFPEGFLDEDRFVVTQEDALGLQSVAVYALRR